VILQSADGGMASCVDRILQTARSTALPVNHGREDRPAQCKHQQRARPSRNPNPRSSPCLLRRRESFIYLHLTDRKYRFQPLDLVYIRYHKPLIRRHHAFEFPDPAASSLPACLSSDHSDEWTSGAWQLHERDHSRTARPIVALRS
jgi:hypothetical protein